MRHKNRIAFSQNRVLRPLRLLLFRSGLLYIFFICGLQACNLPGPGLAQTPIPLTASLETSIVEHGVDPAQDGAQPVPGELDLATDNALVPSPESISTTASTPSALLTPSATLTVVPTAALLPGTPRTLGYSTNLHPIEVYPFGDGPERIVFIGGIHGGYEWNTILLAYQAVDYFVENPDQVPPGTSLYIIPAANPDGQVRVVGHPGRFTAAEVGSNTKPGRFNGAMVDLNRNWDCNWSPEGKWGDSDILTGTEAFSEVETRILRDFLLGLPADQVVFWHSAASAVYAAGCGELYEPAVELASRYARVSGYVYQENFTAYAVTGDATDWLSTVGIPAITVELSSHTDLDWERNLKAILDLLVNLATPESQSPDDPGKMYSRRRLELEEQAIDPQ